MLTRRIIPVKPLSDVFLQGDLVHTLVRFSHVTKSFDLFGSVGKVSELMEI